MKTCSRCQQEKPETSFTTNRSRQDGLNSACRICHNRWTQAHYAHNKAYYKAKAKQSKKKVRDWVSKYKSSNPCTDCGKRFPPECMDFDHLGRKRDNVSKMYGLGFKAVREEIKKCNLVCACCHRQRTQTRIRSVGEMDYHKTLRTSS